MVNDGDRITFSVGEGEANMVNEFDDYFEEIDDSYNRTQRIKEAMEVYLNLHQTVHELEHAVDPDEVSIRNFKAHMRQAILDMDRREAKLERVE